MYELIAPGRLRGGPVHGPQLLQRHGLIASTSRKGTHARFAFSGVNCRSSTFVVTGRSSRLPVV
ncbi:hypothetical protein [Ramlibacter sp. 2FC]|uniref:hypothetical protein n=1 Tax=Ramlibacter sp. 2FC TaxID=2502188 RepID=UPI0010F7A566|nr:hypothetical protein [Ramlibacter sp. 2FC]